MTAQQALEIVEYRRKYCANLYGEGYKVEKPIYEACEKALRFQIEYEGAVEELKELKKALNEIDMTNIHDDGDTL